MVACGLPDKGILEFTRFWQITLRGSHDSVGNQINNRGRGWLFSQPDWPDKQAQNRTSVGTIG
jgi:hypothetical protein